MSGRSTRVIGPALAALAVVAPCVAGCGSSGSTPSTTAGKTVTKTHPSLGTTHLQVTRIGSLPQVVSKAAATALPGGRLMVLGGYAAGRSLDTILEGPPDRLRVVGHLPQPTHDAGAAMLGGSVYLFGGGESVSEPSVVRVDPQSGTAREASALGEPLSDLGAVAVTGRAYLVGGYTGTTFATAILRYLPRGGAHVIARLPVGTRYAGVTSSEGTVYVAGGLTATGPTRAVYALSVTGARPRRVATLPAPEDHAALAALDGRLYLVGGRRVLAIEPGSGKVMVAARLRASLSDPTATTVGRRIVVTGGGTNDVWTLTPTHRRSR